MKSTLYIVSTPIGNLEDITLRALRVLKEVDVIAAEDTRRSKKLLDHYNISKPMISYWSQKERVRSEEIIERLRSGQSVALVSDAGTPGISDPGSVVINKVIEDNIPLVIIPGPSALIAALSLSGLPTEKFTFIGFLPAKKSHRLKILKDLNLERRTLIFYEAPHRLIESLADMKEILTDRKAAVVKEITKMHEEVFRGKISEILLNLEGSTIAGEYVIVIEGYKVEKRDATGDIISEVNLLIRKGLSRKEAVKKVAEEYGMSKKELYDRSLEQTP